MDVLTELRLRRDSGDLAPGDYAEALAVATAPPDALAWRLFVSRAAAALGTAAVVSGVVYLVAWNWSGLGRWSKLTVACGAVVGAAALASALGFDRLGGRLAGAASCGFAGALFVLYTQVYQVGADPWQLFAAFAVITAPYAVATRLSAVAAAGLGSAQVAVLLAWLEREPFDQPGWGLFALGWVAVHVPLLVALHRVEPAGFVSRATSILAVGVPASLAVGAVIARAERAETVGALLLLVAGLHLVRRDLFPLAAGALACGVVAAAFTIRESWDALEGYAALLVAVVVTVIGAGAAAWLRFLHRRNA